MIAFLKYVTLGILHFIRDVWFAMWRPQRSRLVKFIAKILPWLVGLLIFVNLDKGSQSTVLFYVVIGVGIILLYKKIRKMVKF